MRYQITHRTAYAYDHAVSVSHHLARLTPRNWAAQQCLTHNLRVEPAPTQVSRHTDYFGNTTDMLLIESPHQEFVVTAQSTVERRPAPYPDPASTPPWEAVRAAFRGDRQPPVFEASDGVFSSPLVPRRPAFAEFAAPAFGAGRPILDAVLDLTDRIHREFQFDPQATTVATPVDQVLKERRGVCQDFAHLQIACLRSLGLPARYVSGYLETVPPPGKPKLVGADASHAWLAFFCPGVGWIDVDPTNNMLPGERHVTVAWGRDYSDVSPIRGVILSGGQHKLKVSVDMTPIPDPTEL